MMEVEVASDAEATVDGEEEQTRSARMAASNREAAAGGGGAAGLHGSSQNPRVGSMEDEEEDVVNSLRQLRQGMPRSD